MPAAEVAAWHRELVVTQPPQHPTVKKAYAVTPARMADFARFKVLNSKEVVSTDKKGFTKAGDKIYLRLDDGRKIKLINKPVAKFEEKGEEITYIGKLTYSRKYVLNVLYYEAGATLLIDQATGHIDKVQDIPLPSPGVKKLAALFQGYPYEGATNGVDVYTITAGKLQKIFTFESEKWIVNEMAWVNDNSFIMKCLSFADAEKIEASGGVGKLPENSKKFFYQRVTIN
ncbi:MAG: hypothetical protein ACRYFX_31485 [Janthinobacterium lividum]